MRRHCAQIFQAKFHEIMSETLLQENYTCDHLPQMPTKGEIARHFQYKNVNHFFKNVLFKIILPDSEFNYNKIKQLRRLPPKLAIEIYTRYKIQELKN